jgi:flagellar motor switch protein FliM
MERVLTQDEIDAMVRVASGRQGTSLQKETRTIQPCTFRHSGQLASEQVAAVNGLHEGFARNLSQSLGAYLRMSFEVNLVSIEQLAYKEFLDRIPEITYMICFRVEHMSAPAAMQIDQSLVFPLVDILLGGVGHCESLTREVS